MDGQTPSLLVQVGLPILLTVLGGLFAALTAAVPKLLERRGAAAEKKAEAEPEPSPPLPVFEEDPDLDVEGEHDVTILVRTIVRLGDRVDGLEADVESWRTRALRCEQSRGRP